TVGSAVVLLVLYLASLILLTGFHPINFVKLCAAALTRAVDERRERRRERLSEEELFEANQLELARQAEKMEKRLRPKRPELLEPEPAEPEPEPAPEEPAFPEPKIIDTSVPKPGSKKKLPPVPRRKKADLQTGLQEVHLDNYELPPLDLLDPPDEAGRVAADPVELKAVQDIIVDTLGQFGITTSPGDITKGPTITRYEIYPAKGVRVDRIVSLERDIARATRAERINIIAPIPGKDTVGIEIANDKKVKITVRELFESEAWSESKAKLPLTLGKDVYGNAIIGDLGAMPHCLVAGTTGSGKSVCINSIIASLLFRFTPEELRFIMIDPKVVEMQIYNTLPHLVTPVVTDPKKVLMALRWVVDEMDLRYRIFAKTNVRNITTFNDRPKPKTQAEIDAEAKVEANASAPTDSNRETEANVTTDDSAPWESADDSPEPSDPSAAPPVQSAATPPSGNADTVTANDPDEPDEDDDLFSTDVPASTKVPRDVDDIIIPDQMPYIVVIIDELADLMQTAPADVEASIARIAQKARASGIHLVVATQTPRADVVTGIIKANIPSRIAFQVASKIDSRVILDENGAERLIGQGDMLYLPPGTAKLVRTQGVLVTDDEIARIVEFVSNQTKPQFEPSIHEKLTSNAPPEEEVSDADEELVDKCLEIIKQEGKASTSMLQRRLRLGYTRAARIVDILEQRGILGPKDGTRDREILVDLDSIE
ncbi:MAG: DNA translocase FtsK, partial [Chthoniobacterales bacterium]